MSKIQSIHIRNFKFFGEVESINIKGKNLLLYGENGSGKSSIYNALYTIFEAASKSPDGVKKYFAPLSPENSQSLVNIHAEPGEDGIADSFIEMIDENDKSYRLSYNETDLCGDLSFQESQRASAFINYQTLFHFQLFRNSEESNLREVFKHAIIPYLPCSGFEYMGKTIKTVSDLFKAYLNQDALKIKNKNGKPVIYLRSKLYQNFIELEKKINAELRGVIEYVNEQFPVILGKLGYSFSAYLRYENQRHKKYDRWIEYFPFGVFLEIDEYEGKTFDATPIQHPNVFLNEAKMSALAFAIRWAILTKPASMELVPDALRVLVLDDIMISLDMCNRENLIKLLLGPDANNYQLLFMTHDRNLYNFVKEKIDENLWIVKEMYVGEEDGTNKEFPVIIDGEEEPIEKAKKFYKTKDYVTAGLYIRKAFEKLFVHLLPQELYLKPEGGFVSLQTLWEKLQNFYSHNGDGIAPEVIELFKDSKLLVLNPDAHYQRLATPVYRNELKTAFSLYEKLSNLSKIERELVIPKGTIAEFDAPEVNYYCRFEFDNDLIIIEGDNLISVMPKCKNIYWRYNGIEYYDFETGVQNLNHPLKTATPKFHKFLEGITKKIPLGITEEKFMKKCNVNGITLDDCMAGIKISSLILLSTCV